MVFTSFAAIEANMLHVTGVTEDTQLVCLPQIRQLQERLRKLP